MNRVILAAGVFLISTHAFARGQDYDPSFFLAMPFIVAAIVFAIVMTVVWIIVPFAIIGIKPLLRELIEETRRANMARDVAAIRQERDREPRL